MLLELDDVGRREIVRDQDGVLLGAGRRDGAGPAEQALQHALDDMDHVGLALAQVLVLDLVELLDQDVHLLGKRPLSVAVLLGDDLLRHVRQRRIVQDHPVHVEERAELGGRVAAGHRAVQALELGLHLVDRGREARDLGLDLRLRNGVVRDLEHRVRDELRPSDRDSARYAYSVQCKAGHSRSSVQGGQPGCRPPRYSPSPK